MSVQQKRLDIDLRYTHEKEVIMGLDKPKRAKVFCMANYPSDEFLRKCDLYVKALTPPNLYWDEFVNARDKGKRGVGWERFKTKYLEYLQENDTALLWCKRTRAWASSRPIYLCHHIEDMGFSPARLALDFIRNIVRLKVERGETNEFLGHLE